MVSGWSQVTVQYMQIQVNRNMTSKILNNKLSTIKQNNKKAWCSK